MGVYISNMKIPESCGRCPFVQEGEQKLSLYWCYLNGKNLYIFPDRRDKDCPLVEANDWVIDWGKAVEAKVGREFDKGCMYGKDSIGAARLKVTKEGDSWIIEREKLDD